MYGKHLPALNVMLDTLNAEPDPEDGYFVTGTDQQVLRFSQDGDVTIMHTKDIKTQAELQGPVSDSDFADYISDITRWWLRG
jgi:hypothetical protein